MECWNVMVIKGPDRHAEFSKIITQTTGIRILILFVALLSVLSVWTCSTQNLETTNIKYCFEFKWIFLLFLNESWVYFVFSLFRVMCLCRLSRITIQLDGTIDQKLLKPIETMWILKRSKNIWLMMKDSWSISNNVFLHVLRNVRKIFLS